MRIITGIASTTHIDAHNEQMSRGALHSMAAQIKARFIPLLINHDPNMCIGVSLWGEVFQLGDGEHALGIVSGIFEGRSEMILFETREANDLGKYYRNYLNIDRLAQESADRSARRNSLSDFRRPVKTIAELLEKHLDSTSVMPNGRVYRTKRLVGKTGDLKIHIYSKEHNPPHFHIISTQRDINARFDINTLEHLSTKRGYISRQDKRKVQDFFKTKPDKYDELRSEHARLNPDLGC